MENNKRKIILGTDWWTDCDDVAAVRIACRADKKGLWELMGVACNAVMEYSIPSLDAFLTYEGHPNIPLGADFEATDYTGRPPYQKMLSEYPHTRKDNSSACDGLQLYLDILSKADGKVEILEIGFPQILAALCAHPDGYRYLREKVECVWMMAGNWENNGVGSEHNIALTSRSRKAAEYFFENCPCPIMLLGFEVGHSVISGKPEHISDDDLFRKIFVTHGSVNGRSSWDPMLVLLALARDPGKSGYDIRRGYASADAETGDNHFKYDENGPHAYVVKTKPDEWYEAALADWLKS